MPLNFSFSEDLWLSRAEFVGEEFFLADFKAYIRRCRRRRPLPRLDQMTAEENQQYQFMRECLRGHLTADELWHESWPKEERWLTYISNAPGLLAARDVWDRRRWSITFVLREDDWVQLPSRVSNCSAIHPVPCKNLLTIQMFLIKPLDPAACAWFISNDNKPGCPIASLIHSIQREHPKVNLERCRLVLRYIEWNSWMDDQALTWEDSSYGNMWTNPQPNPDGVVECRYSREKNVMLGIYEWTGDYMAWLFYREYTDHKYDPFCILRPDPFGNFRRSSPTLPEVESSYEPRPRCAVEFR